MRPILLLLAVSLLLHCSPQRELDLAVTWDLETNLAEGGGHGPRFTIRNNSDIELTSANWELSLERGTSLGGSGGLGNIADRTGRIEAVATAWNAFANALGRREFPRLDRLTGGYDYWLAPPGAKVENGRLVATTAYPGMVVGYTTDGSDPTAASPLHTGPVDVAAEVVTLSTFDSRGRSSLPAVVSLRR
jgi:hypothetical protein